MSERIVYECRHCGTKFSADLGGRRTEAKYCSQVCYRLAKDTPEARATRFWAKVDKSGPTGIHSQTGIDLGPCWLWTGALNSHGYGKCRSAKRYVSSHVLAYEMVRGEIPDGMDIDHLCRVRACCNPVHLEPVSRRVNLHRGVGAIAINARKTVCINGHPLDGDNVRRSVSKHGPKRFCRTCHRQYESRRRRKLKGLVTSDEPLRRVTA